MTISEEVVRQVLQHLKLRQTHERLAILQLLLERPGLSAAALLDELGTRGVSVNRRTVYRLLTLVRSPAGCLARWQVIGPVWVCWGCGHAFPSSRNDPSTATCLAQGVLPVDLGGYCARCQAHLAGRHRGDEPPGFRKGRAASPLTNRRVTVMPVDTLYQNPNLMRELLGSDRRLVQRDYVVANVAENPRSGPTAVHQVLHEELPVVPTLRSVKRVSAMLHSPKAHILFSSLGAVGWTCLACSRWSTIPNPAPLHLGAPQGFFPTDVRALCPSCREKGRRSCHNSAM